MKYVFNNISEEKFLQAKSALKQKGGVVYTNQSFEIMGVEGYFKHSGTTLEITITDKPWLASWEMIETELRKFFE